MTPAERPPSILLDVSDASGDPAPVSLAEFLADNSELGSDDVEAVSTMPIGAAICIGMALVRRIA